MHVANPADRLWTLNTPRVPEGVDDAQVRKYLLEQRDIEIAGGFGPLAGKVFRIGLMGYGSTAENVLRNLQPGSQLRRGPARRRRTGRGRKGPHRVGLTGADEGVLRFVRVSQEEPVPGPPADRTALFRDAGPGAAGQVVAHQCAVPRVLRIPSPSACRAAPASGQIPAPRNGPRENRVAPRSETAFPGRGEHDIALDAHSGFGSLFQFLVGADDGCAFALCKWGRCSLDFREEGMPVVRPEADNHW